MKVTNTIAQLFPVARAQLMRLELDVASAPENWHAALQKCIDKDAFFKVELGFNKAGLIDARIVVVDSNTGEIYPVARALG